jgi:hypothetical protein
MEDRGLIRLFADFAPPDKMPLAVNFELQIADHKNLLPNGWYHLKPRSPIGV